MRIGCFACLFVVVGRFCLFVFDRVGVVGEGGGYYGAVLCSIFRMHWHILIRGWSSATAENVLFFRFSLSCDFHCRFHNVNTSAAHQISE